MVFKKEKKASFDKDLKELDDKIQELNKNTGPHLKVELDEKKYGDWQAVAELEDFTISFRPGSLLTGSKAEVTFLYKLPKGRKDFERKKLVIFGNAEAVQDRAMMVIKRKKNHQAGNDMQNQFKHTWQRAVTNGYAASSKNINPFDLTDPKTLLDREIERTGIDKKSFADQIGKKSASLYHHTRGTRDISREAAIDYAAKLNIDPVDLLFNKITIPVWAKANTLRYVETDESHQPCKLYSYYAKEPKMVIVPRDIYRSNLKAIQIEANGSMYDGQVAFYYYSNSVKFNAANKLCVVGVKEKGFMDVEEINYYFGLLEEIRGKTNLINPDPYAEEQDKIIKKNINPVFTAPVISMVNPEQIKDATVTQKYIPSEYLRSEEKLKQKIAYLQSDLERMKRKDIKYEKIEEEVRRTLDKLARQQQEIDGYLKNQDSFTKKLFDDVSEIKGFGKKRA